MNPPLTKTEAPEDQCERCGGDLIVIMVTQKGDPHDSWLVHCNRCGLEEARENLRATYGFDDYPGQHEGPWT